MTSADIFNLKFQDLKHFTCHIVFHEHFGTLSLSPIHPNKHTILSVTGLTHLLQARQSHSRKLHLILPGMTICLKRTRNERSFNFIALGTGGAVIKSLKFGVLSVFVTNDIVHYNL